MPSPTSEQLLADVRWVDALAHSLVSDPATADDLAQEAWYRALRSGESRPPRRWFSTVVRRLSIQGHRGAMHRGDRERVAARAEALPPAGDVVERTERQQLLIAAVMRLEEPLRRTVLLRYVDGLDTAEIARRTEAPPATVRTRLKRGLEKLREDLDRRHGGRRAWAGAAAGGASLDPRPYVPARTVLQLAAVGVAGTLIVGSWWWVKSEAVVLEGEGLSHAGTGRLSEEPEEPEELGENDGLAQPTRDATIADASRRVPAQAASLPGWWLVGRVTGAEGEGLAGVKLEVSRESDTTGTTGLDGTYAIDVSRPFRDPNRIVHSLWLSARAPGYVKFEGDVDVFSEERRGGLLPGGRVEIPFDVQLVPADVELAGRVALPAGCRPEHVAVVVANVNADGSPGDVLDEVSPEADWSFRLHVGRADRYWVVAYFRGRRDADDEPRFRPAARIVSCEVGRRTVAVPDLVPPPDAVVTGVLEQSEGMKRAGIQLEFQLAEGPMRGDAMHGIAWHDGAIENFGVPVAIGEDGRFRALGLARGRYEIRPSLSSGETRFMISGNRETRRTATAPANDLHLEFGQDLVLIHVSAGGRAVPGALVERRVENRSAGSSTGSDGNFRLVHPAGEEFLLRVSHEGYAPRELRYGSGEAVPSRVEVELEAVAAGRLEVVLKGDDQLIAETFRVEIERWDGDRWLELPDLTKNHHRVGSPIQIGVVPEGTYRVRLWPGRANFAADWNVYVAAPLTQVVVPAGETVRHTVELVFGGRIALVPGSLDARELSACLIDSEGTLVQIGASRNSGQAPVLEDLAPVSPDRRQELYPNLPAGTYTLELWDGEEKVRERPVDVVAGRTVDVAMD